MHMITHQPAPPLDQFVEMMLYYKGYRPSHTMEKVVPDGSIYLIFELDGVPRTAINNEDEARFVVERAWVSGVQQSFLTISAVNNSEMFVIKFMPYGAFPILKYPLSELRGKVTPAEKLFGEPVFLLRDEIIQTADEMGKLRAAESWLKNQLDPARVPPPFLITACHTMKHDPTLMFNSISDLITNAGVSKKHFVNQFKKYTALTPKQLQRIFRFNEILPIIQENQSIDWVQIALSCGYYDQAHFIKEFKTFCGMNPSRFIIDYHGSERLNFFPLD